MKKCIALFNNLNFDYLNASLEFRFFMSSKVDAEVELDLIKHGGKQLRATPRILSGMLISR